MSGRLMQRPNRTQRRQSRRRGLLSLELLIVLPVAALVAFAMVELGLLLAASSRVNAAASAAGREASLPGATEQSIQETALAALGDAKFANACRITARFADPSLENEALEFARSGDFIRVTVKLKASEASPDLLSIVGWKLKHRMLTSSFVVRRE